MNQSQKTLLENGKDRGTLCIYADYTWAYGMLGLALEWGTWIHNGDNTITLIREDGYESIAKKKYDRELVFEVDNSKGKVDFLLENKNSKEINYIENVENGSHTFILEKNSSYTLKVKFIGCNGKYKIKLKRMQV